MKKALLIGMAVCLGVALAAPAMAIDWSATGWIGVGFLYHKNLPCGHPNPAFDIGSRVVSAMPGGIGNVTTVGSPTAGGSTHDDWNEEVAYWQLQGMLRLTARASGGPGCWGCWLSISMKNRMAFSYSSRWRSARPFFIAET